MVKIARGIVLALGLVGAAHAAAQATFFQDDGFQGRQFTADGPVENLANSGFNDEISAIAIRGGAWQVCSDAYFQGRCVVLQPGEYPSMRQFGMNDAISSARPLSQSYGRYEPRDRDSRYSRDYRYGQPQYDYRYDQRQYEDQNWRWNERQR